MDANRQVAASIDGADRVRDAIEPAQTLIARCRYAAVGILVAEVPAPEGGMSGQSACALAGKRDLRTGDVFVRVPIADAAIDDPLAGDDPEAGPFPRTSEGPLGNEVRAAHVPGEERGDDLELRARRDVRDGEIGRAHVLTPVTSLSRMPS